MLKSITQKGFKMAKSNIKLHLKTWEVKQSMFDNWISPDACIPDENKRGCVMDSMTFLQIIPKDLGKYFSQMRSQIQNRGTYYSEMYEFLNVYNNKHHVPLILNEFNIWKNNHFNELHDYLFEKIKENHATLFSFYLSQTKSTDFISHTVILMKVKIDNEYQLIFLEPQVHNYTEYNRDNTYKYETFYNYFAKYNTIVDFNDSNIVYNTEIKLVCEYDNSKMNKDELDESIVVEFLDNETLVSFPITNEQLLSWAPLNKHIKLRYDCYYNVTSLLNIIPRELANYYSGIVNQPSDIACLTQDIASKRFMSIMYDFYTDDYDQKYILMLKHLEFAEAVIPQLNYTVLSLDVFKQFLKIHLKKSEATPIWLRRGENVGHCVVIAKDNHDNLIIFDAQMDKKYSETENEIEPWFEKQQFTSVDFLIKFNTGKRLRTRSKPNQNQSQSELSASMQTKKIRMSSKSKSSNKPNKPTQTRKLKKSIKSIKSMKSWNTKRNTKRNTKVHSKDDKMDIEENKPDSKDDKMDIEENNSDSRDDFTDVFAKLKI